jgi:hypothetical protein
MSVELAVLSVVVYRERVGVNIDFDIVQAVFFQQVHVRQYAKIVANLVGDVF